MIMLTQKQNFGMTCDGLQVRCILVAGLWIEQLALQLLLCHNDIIEMQPANDLIV